MAAPPEPQAMATNSTINDFKVFDYVVIGGGTAGLACAAKLSDDPSVTVGVLEAGEWRPNDPKIDYPVMIGQSLMDPKYDWCLKTVPQKNSNDREWVLPRGKVLGGSSALNFLCWQRGHSADFDSIEKLGNPGWDWSSLTPYYKSISTTSEIKSPAQGSHLARVNKSHHGDEGPVQVTFSSWYTEAQLLWNKMLKDQGHQEAEDGCASGENSGIWNCPSTMCPDTNLRSYAANAYYEPNAKRTNFKVLTGANVARIELASDNGLQKATGVSYFKDGKEHVVKIRKEVIVSAGTFKSPQVLELSGIGNAEVLKSAGIEVKVESSGVGKNLQEHMFTGAVFEVNAEKAVTWDSMRKPEFAQKSMEQFLAKDDKLSDRGIVGSTVSGFAFHSLESFLSKEEVNEIHRQVDQGDMSDWSEGMKQTNQLQLDKWLSNKAPAMEQILIPGFLTSDGAPKDGAGYLTSVVALQYPFSRGTVHITSDDIDAPPAIDPKYFSNNADLQIMALSLKHVVESVESGPLKDIVLDLHTPSHSKYKTVKDYEEYIKDFTGTTYHPVGTCSMMSQEKGGVVDNKLKVYGTSNIRVADASIIPVMPSGHILSACYVVGVKGEHD
ncbi:hypothetical protein CBS101457_001718 [Exobasidium rhododendri]|nr:hypothetical protein CBS101457_001718 [Exobasidium rhododendri]